MGSGKGNMATVEPIDDVKGDTSILVCGVVRQRDHRTEGG